MLTPSPGSHSPSLQQQQITFGGGSGNNAVVGNDVIIDLDDLSPSVPGAMQLPLNANQNTQPKNVPVIVINNNNNNNNTIQNVSSVVNSALNHIPVNTVNTATALQSATTTPSLTSDTLPISNNTSNVVFGSEPKDNAYKTDVDRGFYDRVVRRIAIVTFVLLAAAFAIVAFAPIGLPASIAISIMAGIAGALTGITLAIFIQTLVESRATKLVSFNKQDYEATLKPKMQAWEKIVEDHKWVPWDENQPSVIDSSIAKVMNIVGHRVYSWKTGIKLLPYAIKEYFFSSEKAAEKKAQMEADKPCQRLIDHSMSKYRNPILAKVAYIALFVVGTALVAAAALEMIPFIATPLLINVAIFTGSGIAAVALWYLTKSIVYQIGDRYSQGNLSSYNYQINKSLKEAKNS